MCHRLLRDARFHLMQLKFDADLAAEWCCSVFFKCAGRLDVANYPRKTRGVGTGWPDGYERKFSFCCSTEGCRQRSTPPSVRFLGRRVYAGAVVVLACAMQQGATPVRAKRLRELLGVSLRTLARWRSWWAAAFMASSFWKAGKVFFSPAIIESGFPLALLERFGTDEEERLAALLRFIKPLSTPAERGA